jgi:dienelactone hydrolase
VKSFFTFPPGNYRSGIFTKEIEDKMETEPEYNEVKSMPSRILSSTENPALQPAYGLWQLYHPESAPYHFQASSLEEALSWQYETRQAFSHALGFEDLPTCALSPEMIEAVDCGDYFRQKILIQPWQHAAMPVYLLTPKQGRAPYPTVLALHGHGYGVKDIVGLWEDGEERATPDGYHQDFAVALARRGFMVAAPEISCFGERQTDFSHLNKSIGQEVPSTCQHTAMLALHLGGSAVGLRVREAVRVVDYLAEQPDVDIDRLGAMGISGGGMHAFFSACIDERIRACVISGYFSTFRESILAMDHCPCNFVPGLHRFGEMHDLAGLVAPRPMLIEAGSRDPIFPVAAVKFGVDKARRVYNVFGADGPAADFFEGRHQISGRLAYDFLSEALS